MDANLIYAPSSHDSTGLKEHAELLARPIIQQLDIQVKSMLVSEIRNALAPIALMAGLSSEEVTPEVLASIQYSVDRLLALATALSKR